MKIWVARISHDSPQLWGRLNEAVVRADSAEDAKMFFMGDWDESERQAFSSAVLVAQLNSDGPAGIVSGTRLS